MMQMSSAVLRACAMTTTTMGRMFTPISRRGLSASAMCATAASHVVRATATAHPATVLLPPHVTHNTPSPKASGIIRNPNDNITSQSPSPTNSTSFITTPSTTTTVDEEATSITTATTHRVIVSSPHPISQIRLLRTTRAIRSDSLAEQRYTNYRVAVQLWHHRFWLRNNTLFRAEQALFQRSVEDPTDHTALADFYREHLNRVRVAHLRYSTQWWHHNLTLVRLGTIAMLHRLVRRTTSLLRPRNPL